MNFSKSFTPLFLWRIVKCQFFCFNQFLDGLLRLLPGGDDPIWLIVFKWVLQMIVRIFEDLNISDFFPGWLMYIANFYLTPSA